MWSVPPPHKVRAACTPAPATSPNKRGTKALVRSCHHAAPGPAHSGKLSVSARLSQPAASGGEHLTARPSPGDAAQAVWRTRTQGSMRGHTHTHRPVPIPPDQCGPKTDTLWEGLTLNKSASSCNPHRGNSGPKTANSHAKGAQFSPSPQFPGHGPHPLVPLLLPGTRSLLASE